MPFVTDDDPAIAMFDGGSIKPKKSMLVMQHTGHFSFDVCMYALPWKIVRLLWIGYYNNDKNEKCLIQKLPKDILSKIIKLLDNRSKHHQKFDTSNMICLHD